MAISKFLDPKNDLAFKRVFGSEKNKDILIHFLNDIFAGQITPVKNVRFLKPNQEPEISSQRVSLIDIFCEGINGEHFIIEMQVLHEPGFEKRAQFYAARAYIDQRQKGTEYRDLQQVIFLAITDFVVFPKKNDYLSHHYILDSKTYERDLKDFSFSFLELPKFEKNADELETMIEKWAYFFKHAQESTEKEVDVIFKDDIAIKSAYEALNRFNWSIEEMRTYNSVDMKMSADRAILWGARQEGHKEGLEKGLQEGHEKGIQEGIRKERERSQLEFALTLLQKKYEIQTVAELTALKTEQVKKLAEEHLH